MDLREGVGLREFWIQERDRGREKVGSKRRSGVERRLDPREGVG